MAPLASALLLTCWVVALAPSAQANDEAKINERNGAWGSACKKAVAATFPKSTMPEIQVEPGATLQQSIDYRDTTLKDI